MKKVLIIIPFIIVVLLFLLFVGISANEAKQIEALETELNTVSVERNNYMEESQDLQSKLDELQKQYDELKKENEELKAEPEPEAVEEIIISTPEVEVVEEAPAETAVEVPEEPAVEEEPEAEEVFEEETIEAASNLVYLGTFEMTAYEWTGNPCANGNYPTQGYTVACNSLPLGTQVYIDGYGYYVVEDRGASWHGDNWMDMYLGDVNACYQWGIKYLDVYLVE